MKVQFTDPNWPCNNGEIGFPLSVVSGWELWSGGKRAVCPTTMTIHDEAELLRLFGEWSAPS